MMEQNLSSTNSPMTTEPINKLLLKFAIPSVISFLVNTFYNIVDQYFIGQKLGYSGTAATTIAMPIAIIALAVSLLVGDGAGAFLSIRMGEGKRDDAKKGVGNSITMLVIIGILFCIVTLLLRVPLVKLFGATDETLNYSIDYFSIIVIGTPCCMLANGFISILRADGNPKISMFSMIVGAVINLLLDPLFIFIFNWGVGGAALATILGQFGSFLIGLLGLKKLNSFKLDRESFKLDLHMCKSVVTLGTASFLSEIALTFVLVVMNNALKIYGEKSIYGGSIPLSAAGVVNKVYQITNSFILGIALGAQPIVGFNYGARNMNRVKKTYLLAVKWATIITTISFVVYMVFPHFLISLFDPHNHLYQEFGVKYFRIYLFLCIPLGFQTVTSIFFQSIGKPLKSTILTMSRQVLFFLPAILILPLLFQLDGCLMAGPVADGLSSILAFILIKKQWKYLKKDAVLD